MPPNPGGRRQRLRYLGIGAFTRRKGNSRPPVLRGRGGQRGQDGTLGAGGLAGDGHGVRREDRVRRAAAPAKRGQLHGGECTKAAQPGGGLNIQAIGITPVPALQLSASLNFTTFRAGGIPL